MISAEPSTYNGNDKFHYLSYARPIKEVNAMTNFYNKLINDRIPTRKLAQLFPSNYLEFLTFLCYRTFTPINEIRHSNSHHSMHPTFRKRSTSENTIASSDDISDWKLHRTSRYKLYKHLEKFIDT